MKSQKTFKTANVEGEQDRHVIRQPKKKTLNVLHKTVPNEPYLPVKEDTIFDSIQMICNANVEALRINEPGARLGTEPEFLHQMRIAVRRLRVVITSFKDFFPANLYKHLHSRLLSIFKTLGKEREMDVVLLMLLAETEKHPDKADRFQDCIQWLNDEKQKYHQTTLDLLDSEIYSAALDELQSLHTLRDEFPPQAFHQVGEAVPGLLKRHWKLLRKQGDLLTLKSEDDEFHEMRIACKKMRYQCEFMQPVLHENVPDFINQMKTVQATLGALQDMVTAQEALKPYIEMKQREHDEAHVKSVQKFINKLDKKSRRQQTGFFVLWDKTKQMKPKTLFC